MKKCVICQSAANDLLAESIPAKKFLGMSIDLGKKTTSYCRPHLIDVFKGKFVSSGKKMIVIHPKWEERMACVYGYMGVEELRSRRLYEPCIREVFLNINSACSSCAQPASVAYYGLGVIKDQHLGFGNYPDFEHLPASLAAMLCAGCAFDSIGASLRNFPGVFAEGLFLPAQEDGVYFPANI